MRTFKIIDLPSQPKKKKREEKASSHSWSGSPTNNIK